MTSRNINNSHTLTNDINNENITTENLVVDSLISTTDGAITATRLGRGTMTLGSIPNGHIGSIITNKEGADQRWDMYADEAENFYLERNGAPAGSILNLMNVVAIDDVSLRTDTVRTDNIDVLAGSELNIDTGVYINSDSVAALLVQKDDSTDRFKVDCSTGLVTVSEDLTVGDTLKTDIIDVFNGSELNINTGVYINSDSVAALLVQKDDSTDRFKVDNSTGLVTVGEDLTVGGEATFSGQPYGFAARTSDQVVTASTIELAFPSNQSLNGGITLANSDRRFTVATAGVYMVNACIHTSGSGNIYLKKNTSTIQYGREANTSQTVNLNVILEMAANDYVVVWANDILSFQVLGNTTTNYNHFSITKLS